MRPNTACTGQVRAARFVCGSERGLGFSELVGCGAAGEPEGPKGAARSITHPIAEPTNAWIMPSVEIGFYQNDNPAIDESI